MSVVFFTHRKTQDSKYPLVSYGILLKDGERGGQQHKVGDVVRYNNLIGEGIDFDRTWLNTYFESWNRSVGKSEDVDMALLNRLLESFLAASGLLKEHSLANKSVEIGTILK